MRFVKLRVEAFQAIERADVEFGPGLNILYGPNDLGKSSLARAIRSALLLSPKSAEADELASWYADAIPRVELTFVDDSEHYWQVKKAFANGTGANAELLHSKDGKHFSIDCKARAVDEKVRALLGWGIPAPGGKGGPRGLPESFLANALLAAQSDVHAILAASLEKDADESGKVRLQKALATLAQDPLFKRVLDAAQAECDLCFTPKGKLRRALGSKLVTAADEVKRYQAELEVRKQELQASRGIEEQVSALLELRQQAMVATADAEAALALARAGLANSCARVEAERLVTVAKQALAQIDEQATRVQALALQRASLEQAVVVREAELAKAGAECERGDAAVRAAEDAKRAATSEVGEQQRELRAAELKTLVATLDAQCTQLEARREKAAYAQSAAREVTKAVAELDAIKAKQVRFAQALKQAEVDAGQAGERMELARALLAYGRWRSAVSTSEEAAEAKRKAVESRAHATTMETEAEQIEARAKLAEAAVAERRGLLPAAELLQRLDQLQRALEVAEASLGGGLSIVVRPKKAIRIGVSSDHSPSVEEADLASERAFEAERSFHLTIADVMELDISAGAAEKRHAVEQLRARWKSEGVPVLERAGAATLVDVAGAVARVQSEQIAIEELRRQSANLHSEAKALRDRAGLLGQQAAKATDDERELGAKRAAVGSIALEQLEVSLKRLGKSWESQAEDLHERRRNERALSEESRAKSEQALQLGAYQLVEAEKVLSARRSQSEAAARAIDGQEPGGLLQALASEQASLVKQQQEARTALAALAKEASSARADAEHALQAAIATVERAKARQAEAQKACDGARAALNNKIGECMAQEQLLARTDRSAALVQVQTRETELHALPSAPLATEADVHARVSALERSRRDLADKTAEFHKADGALTKVGGAQLRERVEQIQDALEAATAREHELELDAKAWLLLRDTLREAENTQGAHLGRALGGPVGDKFLELTQGRYAKLCFDPLLTAESLEVTGATSNKGVLAALSVGTRDQLATLVRLTIADQLKSAIILDDHLVHTDPVRLAWFREVLMKTAIETQVLVFTCRPEDYLSKGELPVDGAVRDLAGGSVRAVDLARVVRRAGFTGAALVEGFA